MRSLTSRQSQAIGVFDSGVGGLTVMQHITKVLPKENIVYFGDTARVPYGGKSAEIITRYSIDNAIFLMSHNIKALVIACNTASSCALEKLQQIFNIPVIGTIYPAAEYAVKVTKMKKIAVLGTKATVNSGIFQKAIQLKIPDAEVISVPCPLFVPLVEEGLISHQACKLLVREYLSVLKDKNVDTVILGCTHYPLLRSIIAEELEPHIQIVDSAHTCAEAVNQLLQEHQLCNQQSTSGNYKYFVSDDPKRFREVGERFLGMPLDQVQIQSPDRHG